jgi:AcrR family transcriptional regulator
MRQKASIAPQRQRAIGAAEKETRRNALLDAAERMFVEHAGRLASVAEVATAAGLAKGTVYLYFPSKEELLLALHERHVSTFFNALFELLDGARKLTIDDVIALTGRYMVEPAGFLPLASLCMGMMEKSIPTETQLKFHLGIAYCLNRAGAGLERHFAGLRSGEGAGLLMRSYGLILGLWQMLQPGCLPAQLRGQPGLELFERDYRTELEVALRALWSGHVVTELRAGKQVTPQKHAAVKPKQAAKTVRKSRKSR